MNVPAPLHSHLADLHAVVHGHVHGVGFRAWTERQAARLGLTGWVRNVPDGTVEMLVQGPRDQVVEVLRKLKASETPGEVEWVDRDLREPTETFRDFTIR